MATEAFVATSGRQARLWAVARWTALAATFVLLAGLIVRPALSLVVLWSVLIPLVPASLLVSPMIWRNVCPLATVNLLTNRAGVTRRLANAWLPAAAIAGIGLLAVMVPARRFLFNLDGPVLAITIVGVAGLALVAGAFVQLKAGFCNAICPVLPVERLYGQHPLITIPNARCASCTVCTPRGCIDLNPRKSAVISLGATARSNAWLTTGFGIFAAAFPGFIVGYFVSQDGAWTAAGSVYAGVAAASAASFVAVAVLVRLLHVSAERALVWLATVAVGLYYWYAAASSAQALGLGTAAPVALRASAYALLGVWLWRALRSDGRHRAISSLTPPRSA